MMVDRWKRNSLALLLRFKRDTKGAVAILLAFLLFPMIATIGLAIDYSVYSQTISSLSLAANAAALEAAKVGAASELTGDTNYANEGIEAGSLWFTAQLTKNFAGITVTANAIPTVTVTGTSNVIATVTYSTAIPSIFGKIFNVLSYPAAANATAQVNTAPYLEVVILMDNSASMGLGATPTDMTTLLQNSACFSSEEFTTMDGTNYSSVSGTNYGNYSCLNYNVTNETTYSTDPTNGIPDCPVTSASGTVYPPEPDHTHYNDSYPSVTTVTCPDVNGHTAYAGAPCAFACHSDGSKPAGLGNDLWALARQKGVTLRLDLVKNATSQMLQTMETDNQVIDGFNTLSVGIYTFNTSVTQIYPTSGSQAGSDWTTAISDVGSPPASGSYVDTGIQPVVASSGINNNDTNFQEAMTSLAATTGSSGDGTTPSSPQKVLFLVTDGVEDNSLLNLRAAMPYTSCDIFKKLGYQVYVLYTTYYPVAHDYYESNMTSFVTGTDADTSSIAYNLESCSSSPSLNQSDLKTYYVEASSASGITGALNNFLNAALNSPARFSSITN